MFPPPLTPLAGKELDTFALHFLVSYKSPETNCLRMRKQQSQKSNHARCCPL